MAQCPTVNIGPEDPLGQFVGFGIRLGMTGYTHLRIEPGCLAGPGEIGGLAVLKHEIRNMNRFTSFGEEYPVGHGSPNCIGCRTYVIFPRKNADDFVGSLRIDKGNSCTIKGTNKLVSGLRILVHARCWHGQHLFNAAPPDLRCRDRDCAVSAIDRNTVPGLSHAYPVYFALSKRVSGERRRYDGDLDVAVRVNTAASQPVAKHVVVAGMAMHHAESKVRALVASFTRDLSQLLADRGRIAGLAGMSDAIGDFRSHCHGISVQAEHEGHRQRRSLAPDTEGDGNRQGSNQMRCVDMPMDQPVANGRPADIPYQFDIEVFILRVTKFAGKDRQGCIDQRKKSDSQFVSYQSSSNPDAPVGRPRLKPDLPAAGL